MALITKGTVTKGTPATFILSKSELETLVLSLNLGVYWSNSSNWKKITVFMVNPDIGQLKSLVFDAASAEPEASFNTSENAMDIFEVKKIILADADGAKKTIKRGSLPVADFDLDIANQSGGGGGGPLVAPNLVSVTPYGADSVIVSWDAVEGAEEYGVYWGTESGVYPPANSLVAGGTSVIVPNLVDGTYFFAVTTFANRDESDYSNELSIEFVVVTINTPANVQGSGGVGTVNLSWDAVTDAEQYNIYRDGQSWSIVNAPDVTYLEESVDAGTYYYTVAAAKNGGNVISAQSEPIEIVVT